MEVADGTPDSPFGHVVVIAYSPTEAFGQFPRFFSQLHNDDIPMHAELLDPVGNVNIVRVEMIGSRCYFTDGWTFLGKFYGIKYGAWIVLDYVRRGYFKLTIKTHKWKKWIYPSITEPSEGVFESGEISERLGDQQLLICNNNFFPFLLVKWVSFSEFTGDVMTLPPEFYTEALINPEDDIYIVDEFGKKWSCFFRRGSGEQAGICVFCKGWATFCRSKSLQQGQQIKFGVTTRKSNLLHFIPVV